MKRANTSRLTATTSRRLWMRSSAPAEASQFGHSWAILYYPSLRRPSRDSKGPVKAGLASRGRTTHKGLAKVSGLRCAARHGSRNSAASRDFYTLIVPWIMLNGVATGTRVAVGPRPLLIPVRVMVRELKGLEMKLVRKASSLGNVKASETERGARSLNPCSSSARSSLASDLTPRADTNDDRTRIGPLDAHFCSAPPPAERHGGNTCAAHVSTWVDRGQRRLGVPCA